jgi:4-alpha-glucanotransferase
MWAIFPIQDLLALKEDYTDRAANEETINDPTNPRHYWRFRLHVPMETLLGDDDFLGTIRDLVVSSGRASDKDFEQVNASMETSAIECEPAVSVQEVSLPAHRNISGVVLNDKKAALERSFSGRVLDDNKHVVEIGCTGRSLVTAL